MGQGNCHPQPGDLIEIDRTLHQHWALYVGDGFVINLTPIGKEEVKLGEHIVPVFTRKVKKQLLNEVVQKDKWRVNNESDEYRTPLPVEEIIQRCAGYIGKEVKYRVFGSSCERFVKKLRYGEQLRAFVGGEEPIPDLTADKDYPQPGDLIEIKRAHYEHWALYMGDGYVIHVTTVDEKAPLLSASSETMLIGKAKVKKELLKKVAGKDKWCINNKYDHWRTPFPAEEIIRRAERWIDRIVLYRLLLKNCEHFVTMLRYGQGISEQAKAPLAYGYFISSAVMLVGMGIYALPAVPVLLAADVGLIGLSFVSIGLGSSNLIHLVTIKKFVESDKDILEQKCC